MLLPSVARPAYDRSALKTGIVHLGIGAFHRAHQAVYTDDVLASGDLSWGIVGASLRSPDTRDALQPQDGLYTLAVRGAGGARHRVIGSVKTLLVAHEAPGALIETMAHPDLKIVSLTVTEKGYCLDPATGRLDERHADIVHDVAHPESPRSALGFLLAALRLRRQRCLAPFTALSCDNLTANGAKLRAALIALAHMSDAPFAKFVEEAVACPSTMIDRIVPQTTDEDRAAVAAAIGLDDAWPVITEPFTQWVIEDAFPLGRPAWDAAGATLAKDVAPFEAMKLKLLNASHSMLAFLGSLAGAETVAEAMGEPILAGFIRAFMDEDVPPVLSLPPGADVHAYAASLVERFFNPTLKHRLQQIASDSSQKIPQRFLGTARERLERGLPLGRLAYGVAGFIRYAEGVDERGRALVLNDPLAADLRSRLFAAGRHMNERVKAALTFENIFGRDLPLDPTFTRPILAAYRLLVEHGVRGALSQGTLE
jgi:fructuronate reductase